MSRKPFRKLSEQNLEAELDDILSLPSTLPDLGFLGFGSDGERLVPSPPSSSTSTVEVGVKPLVSSNFKVLQTEPTSTVEEKSEASVELGSEPTVESKLVFSPTAPLPDHLQNLWISEYGDIIPAKRVHPIKIAQNALTPQEVVVYKSLWAARSCLDREASDAWRIVQVGYKALTGETNINKRSIKPIIERLIYKQCCLVEQEGLTDRTPAVYRVYSYRSILDRLAAQDRTHVVRIGAGILFAKPLKGDVILSAVKTEESKPNSTVEPGFTLTVEAGYPSTVECTYTSTVERADSSTVEAGRGVSTRINLRNIHKEQSLVNESEARELRERLREIAAFDDDATLVLIRRCREKAPDCTLQEIAALAREKARQAKTNKVGFVLEALPKLFMAGMHRELKRNKELSETSHPGDLRSWEELIKGFQGILANPESTQQEKEWVARVAKELSAKAK